MAQESPNPTTSNLPTQTKRKKRKPNPHKNPHILHQRTLQNPKWTYIHLQHITSRQPNGTDGTNDNKASPLDAVTVHLSLTTSLSQFLGLHGSAIRFDILQIEGQDIWIRAPAGDRKAMLAAVGGSRGEEGWRVMGWSFWDAGIGRGGDGVFDAV